VATVLVVDDEPDTLMQVRRALEVAGHEVVLAPDGRQALARVAEQPSDAVVLDLLMPVLGGIEVLTGLQERSVATPVLVLLAGSEADDEGRRALALGALGCLAKPVDSDALGEAVAEVLALTTDGDRASYRQRSIDALG
jgi:CheY-like chemotaxis protein